MKAVRVEPEAEEELAQAIDWYEAQQGGQGAVFYATVLEAVEDVRRYPSASPLVEGAPPDVPARQAFVRRFPYKVIDFDLPEVVHVLAFAHDRRRPFYWRHRV